MSDNTAKLTMLCGKIASGKSTLATRLAAHTRAVLLSEDEWLEALLADEMRTGADYLQYSVRLQAVIAPHVVQLLRAGVSVVLDFPANTKNQRQWMRDVLAATEVDHQLYVLDVSDETCLKRLRARNDQGRHPFSVTEQQFRRFSKHYDPPSPDEGFEIIHQKV